MAGLSLGALACLGFSGYYLLRKQSLPKPEGEPYRQLPVSPYEHHPNKHYLTKVPRRVGIIGTGVAGLCTAKELSQQGFEVEVLEKNPGVGGVWYKNYQDVGLQGASHRYHFPDYAFPDGVETFPKLPVIKKWLEAYTRDFQLDKLIQYNTEVKQIEQLNDGTWTVHLAHGPPKSYDFLTLAAGRFHEPLLPQFAGAAQFKGQIVHSSHIDDAAALFANKKVVIIGGNRSAQEIGRLAHLHASKVTSVMRNVHYCINPAGKFLGRPYVTFLINILAQWCSPAWSNLDSQYVFQYMKPFCTAYYQLLRHFEKDLPPELHCSFDFRKYFPYQVFVADPDFVQAVKHQQIQVVRGSPSHFTEHGIVLNGQELCADVVAMCTGFKPNWFGLEFLEDEFLYRCVLAPKVKNLAVVGHIGTICTPLILNMQAVWLAEMLRGGFALPSVEQMLTDSQQRKARFERDFVKLPLLGHTWLPHEEMAAELLRDMGLKLQRKERLIDQWMYSTMPEDYKTVVTHRI